MVLPTQIQVINDLQGYLRVKGEFPAAKIKLNYADYPLIHEEFIARDIDPDPLRQKVEQLVDTYSDPILAASHDDALDAATSTKKDITKPIAREKKLEEEKELVEFL